MEPRPELIVTGKSCSNHDEAEKVARFAGYASIFNVADQGRDIVRAGAFRKAISQPANIPVLWQHEAHQPIGRVHHVAEDSRGLRVIGHLTLVTRRGAEAHALLRSGVVTGLSFGYRIKASKYNHVKRVRELTELELLEVSLVTFPMQQLARVHAVSAPEEIKFSTEMN
jgi:HK97 family phage prohead protease